MPALNTIPTAAEDSALAPKKDNNPQPEWKTVGKHGVMKPGPLELQTWPEYLSCGDFADPDHDFHSFNKHCDEHDLPKNAYVINVCQSLDKP